MFRRIGLTVDRDPARIDERALDAALTGAEPRSIAEALATAKATEVSARRPDAVVIGADQTLDCEGRSFHKPAGRSAAHRQLLELAGRTHRLTSSAAIVIDGRCVSCITAEARMTMRPLDAKAVDRYLDAAGPDALGSVGCYRVEDLGAALFERMEGDHFTILGLPLVQLLGELRKQGFIQ
jgi:septum formation protein